MWLRLKPVAIFWLTVDPGRRSPASCSIVKRSNGMLRFRASITQSRQGQALRSASRQSDPEQILESVTGLGHEELSKQWHQALRDAYAPIYTSKQEPRTYGRVLLSASELPGAPQHQVADVETVGRHHEREQLQQEEVAREDAAPRAGRDH